MSRKASFFILLVIIAGWFELLRNLFLLRSDDLATFLVYFVIAMLVSGLKLQLPGVTGTISVCFFFVLIGLVSLSLLQVRITVCSSELVQYFWSPTKDVPLVRVLFDIGV